MYVYIYIYMYIYIYICMYIHKVLSGLCPVCPETEHALISGYSPSMQSMYMSGRPFGNMLETL